MSNRQILLSELPGAAALEPRHFDHRDADRPVPTEGEIGLRTILISIDPANRAWMNGPSYRPQISAGEVMAGYALAEVVEPGDSGLAAGSVVFADTGWQEWATVPAAEATPVPIVSEYSHHLSAVGLTGLTAYFGLLDVGAPQAGETIVVSAAAGATGNVVGQIARIKGARVVGITGSDEKNAFLEHELGFDATVNYRTDDQKGALRAACPDGIDVYFDNVGGSLLDLVLARTNLRGRIVCCGAVSGYDGATPTEGPRQVPGRLITHRIRMEGFIVLDHVDRWTSAAEELAGWVRDGQLKVVEDVIDGLEAAPGALIGLLAGDNVGKRMVRVGPDLS
jgi:NADPH-dependent curcumin reductase CurA